MPCGAYFRGFLIAAFIAWPSSVLSETSRFVSEKAPVIAFTGALIIDGTGAKPKANQTLVVRNGRIIAIGPDHELEAPEEAKIIPLDGKSLLPGWVMTHEHFHYLTRPTSTSALGEVEYLTYHTSQPLSYPKLYLSGGVTSARTAGTHVPYDDLGIKKAIDTGKLPGPDYDLTGPYLEGPPGKSFLFHTLKDADEAREMVRFWAGQGFTSFKFYENITRAQAAAAIEEAHAHGAKVTGHLCSLTMREAVDLGIDHIEHGFATLLVSDLNPNKPPDECHVDADYPEILQGLRPDSPVVQDLFHHLKNNDVYVTSTLTVGVRRPLPEDVLALLTPGAQEDYHAFQRNHADLVESNPIIKDSVQKFMMLEHAFWKMGGELTVGTDSSGTGVIAGFSNLLAIELLAETGIPPLEVIKIATHNGAKALGVLEDRGTIETGKRADFLIVNGDPSRNISDIQNIETVFKNGVGYDPAALKESAKGSIGGPR